jgi:hypothetical protein
LITRIIFGDEYRLLSSSLSVRDQVSQPYKTIGKIIVLYILIFVFLIANWMPEDPAPNDNRRNAY